MSVPPLPDDLAGCHALITQLSRAVTELTDEKKTLLEQRAELELALNELMRQAYAKRRERYVKNPNQLQLDFGGGAEAADAADGLADAVEEAGIVVAEHVRRKHPKKPRNEQLPAHLPRYEVEAKVPDDVKTCPRHCERQRIGVDRIETLEFERPKLRVRVTLIPKYACPNQAECGVREPPRPEGLVEGNRYDSSVAAEIVAGKYGYHLPIYRQEDYFAGSGWTPGRSTLLNIQRAVAERIEPLIAHWRDEVLRSGLIGTDDTTVTVLLPPTVPEPIPGDAKSQRIHEVFAAAIAEGKPSVTGRMWAYRSLTVPLNVFDFTVKIGRAHV